MDAPEKPRTPDPVPAAGMPVPSLPAAGPLGVLPGWTGWLVRLSLAALLFETLTGLAITLAPFRAAVQ